ncbi:MAG: hypothetical protein U0871_28010 [Gemmataceae bacterium]
MTEAEWENTHKPRQLVAAATLGIRQQRLLAVAACRTLPSDLLPMGAEGWLTAAERLAERPECTVSHRKARHLASGLRWPMPRPYFSDRVEWAFVSLFTGPLTTTLHCVGVATGRIIPSADHEHPAIHLSDLVRDIVGNPFRPVAFDPGWRTSTAVALARQMYDARDFGLLPVLADALEEAGCDAAALLAHCRGPGPHVRGCWAVDLVLGNS